MVQLDRWSVVHLFFFFSWPFKVDQLFFAFFSRTRFLLFETPRTVVVHFSLSPVVSWMNVWMRDLNVRNWKVGDCHGNVSHLCLI